MSDRVIGDGACLVNKRGVGQTLGVGARITCGSLIWTIGERERDVCGGASGGGGRAEALAGSRVRWHGRWRGRAHTFEARITFEGGVGKQSK